jgi:hypothetical protein
LIPDTTRSGLAVTIFLSPTRRALTGVAVRPMAAIPPGSVKSSRWIGSEMVIECPLPLWLSSGATTSTSPNALSACATARIPGARTPSSLPTRMR